MWGWHSLLGRDGVGPGAHTLHFSMESVVRHDHSTRLRSVLIQVGSRVVTEDHVRSAESGTASAVGMRGVRALMPGLDIDGTGRPPAPEASTLMSCAI